MNDVATSELPLTERRPVVDENANRTSTQDTPNPERTQLEQESARYQNINLLLTGRGFFLLMVIGYLFADPVSQQTDVVASVVAYSLLVMLVVAAAIVIISGITIRRSLALEVVPPTTGDDPTDRVRAGQPCTLVVRTSRVRVFPLFVLRLTIVFEHPEVALAQLQFTGSTHDGRVLPESVTFPHRGRWGISRVDAVYGDQLGLTLLRWPITDTSVRRTCTVNPPDVLTSGLPILSSCQRSGDLVVDQHDRRGDLFDLKSYHPADGMKRILWKIYAKTGQLIARHPEPSMTPEGQVVIFVLANRNDDHVAGTVLSYLHTLEDLGLEIFLSCEGAASGVVHSRDDARDLLVGNVWHDEEISAASQVETMLATVSNALRDGTVDRVLIFGACERLRTRVDLERFLAVAHATRGRGSEPVFIMCNAGGADFDTALHLKGSQANPAASQSSRSWQGWFVDPREEQEQAPKKSTLAEFLNICAREHIQVIL